MSETFICVESKRRLASSTRFCCMYSKGEIPSLRLNISERLAVVIPNLSVQSGVHIDYRVIGATIFRCEEAVILCEHVPQHIGDRHHKEMRHVLVDAFILLKKQIAAVFHGKTNEQEAGILKSDLTFAAFLQKDGLFHVGGV